MTVRATAAPAATASDAWAVAWVLVVSQKIAESVSKLFYNYVAFSPKVVHMISRGSYKMRPRLRGLVRPLLRPTRRPRNLVRFCLKQVLFVDYKASKGAQEILQWGPNWLQDYLF